MNISVLFFRDILNECSVVVLIQKQNSFQFIWTYYTSYVLWTWVSSAHVSDAIESEDKAEIKIEILLWIEPRLEVVGVSGRNEIDDCCGDSEIFWHRMCSYTAMNDIVEDMRLLNEEALSLFRLKLV